MITVGSTAAKYWWGDWREPSDLDSWSPFKEAHPKGVDGHTVSLDIINLIPTEYGHATPDALYTIKCSHLGWENPMWPKHKKDILSMKYRGCRIIPELYVALVEHWKKELGDKSFLSLNKTKDEFFNDNVEYVYDHDYLHELVAYPNRPVYEEVLKENCEVVIDKKLFDELPLEQQVRMFREEITVIAMERWVIPKKIDWYKAYQYSLRKTITNLTKNWATDYIVQNIEKFVTTGFSYFKYILEELNMSNKVDLTPFEALLGKITSVCEEEGLHEVIYALAANEVFLDENYHGLSFPRANGRNYQDETYRAECVEYSASFSAKREHLLNEIGYKHLDQDGGGEGGSEYCWGVFKLGGKTYRASWSYYSHHGDEYENITNTLKEVVAKEVTKTAYE